MRHFSMKVCEKVEQKERTTYNEVADELVAEFAVAATEMVSAVDQVRRGGRALMHSCRVARACVASVSERRARVGPVCCPHLLPPA